MNQPPEYCPYCGTALDVAEAPVDDHSTLESVGTPSVFFCESCDDYVFYNTVPGGSAVVVDGDSLLLVEDFRSPGEWKLPSGRIELGERPSEGIARELEEETGLAVDPDHLVYWTDDAVELRDDQYMSNVNYAVPRSKTSGTLDAGSDATDARFFTPEEFAASEYEIKHTHVARFGDDDLNWILEGTQAALRTHDEPLA